MICLMRMRMTTCSLMLWMTIGLRLTLFQGLHNHDHNIHKKKVDVLVRKKLKEGTEQWKKSPAELWTELCREVTQEVGAMGVVLLGKEDNFKRYGPAFDKFRPFYPTFFRFNRTLCNRRLATLPSIPRTRADLQKLANLPTRFTKTASGDNWLILNTVQDQNKELIIGFVSPAVLC